MIELSQVSLQRGPKILLDHADLRIHPGQHLGLIGANGSGKSTLFQMLLGKLAPDTGSAQIPGQWRIAHMAQEIEHTGRSALDHVLDGDQTLRQVQRQIETAEGEALAAAYAQMEHIDGYTAEARAMQLLAGLGFKPGEEQKPVADFSGGWRIRLNLAQALMCPSDLLLLDEPTNHLDLDTTLWLEQWLKRYAGTLLLISHDRDFLDAVVDRIVNLEAQKLVLYVGNYSAYERQKAERLAQQQAAFEKQQERIAEIENFVRRFRAKATKAKQAQSRLKELERMESIAPAHIDSPFHFSIPCFDKVSNPLINLQQADIGYGKPLFRKLSLTVLPGARIGLLGFNGAGKSTLIKALTGELAPLAGDITRGEHLRIGYFAQHQLQALDLDATPALHLQRLSPKASEQEIRNFLGGFGFIGDDALAIVRPFSGGEKARLALAIIAWQKPNLLLMDEPTNHLDLEMRHALTVALQAFDGAVILVSHDRHLLRNTVEDFWLVHAGKVEPFDGDLDAYHQWTQTQLAGETLPVSAAITEPRLDKKAQRQQAAAQREKIKPLTNAIKKAEREMEQLQSELETLETALADNSLYDEANKDRMNTLFQKQAGVRAQLDETEARWLELSEQLEALEHH
ncbi:ABC-F family ATP-binding cassette domain-containing protein [Simiduia agarivorans]|uniref:Probable ATP-binding protein YheS n=1 Tax=Simiduia agarivorans (strain DSM 21679 / JCM 13881 / BCRC 17597 / SA1) TaxID=1117647 RepID=K4KNQ8_SIMAS|nr:ATP-binding cassette domain-containing protein [Simiduia agarivorans]AFU99738.2 ABC transporter ATP-binding protein [Simiduia agarivorans SA1 = DSM 21679]